MNVADDVVKILLENGARVDAQENVEDSYLGRTPLIMAAQRGRGDVVELVLRKGARVDSQDASGRTALMAAAENGHADVVRLLLAAHADPNVADKKGGSALMSAASRGHSGIVKQLLAAKADPNAAAIEGYTALAAAAGVYAPPSSVIALLDAGANPNPPSTRTSPLLLAVSSGNVPIVKALIAKGANVNFKDPSGQTPLSQATVHKKQEIIQLLVAAGAKQ